MKDLMLKIDHVSKQYRLGQIGGTTLREEMQRLGAKLFRKEDPTRKIGAKEVAIGETFLALSDICLEIRKGERVGIIGHNGAGKSTLLKLISRVTAPTEGSIGLNGRVTSMLEVGTGFHWELTGRENAYVNGAILGMTKREIDAKMEAIIDFSECRQFIDTPVKRYSSGMYVKLAFSVAAHLTSEIMIMDEVLAVGDMAFQKKCLDRMQEEAVKHDRTILYVSHNMNTIRQLCDRCVVLNHGRVVFDGDVEKAIELYASNPASSRLSIDYASIPRESWLLSTKVRTLQTSFLNKTTNVFKQDEPIALQVDWVNEQDVADIGLRIEISNLAGIRVGAALLRKFYSGKKDARGSVQVELNLPSLVSGSYQLYYVFFDEDHNGNEVAIDGVKGLNFDIHKDEGIVWNTQAWGFIHFDDLKLLGVK